jgi:hypothetical protein
MPTRCARWRSWGRESETRRTPDRGGISVFHGSMFHQPRRQVNGLVWRITEDNLMSKHRIYTTSVASVYPHYLAKAEKKGRTKAEVDEIIRWLTGYSQRELEGQLKKETDFETFFAEAPRLNPSRTLVKGVICGVRIEDIKESTMREIRYLDKLIDELAKGRTMDKILRKTAEA